MGLSERVWRYPAKPDTAMGSLAKPLALTHAHYPARTAPTNFPALACILLHSMPELSPVFYLPSRLFTLCSTRSAMAYIASRINQANDCWGSCQLILITKIFILAG